MILGSSLFGMERAARIAARLQSDRRAPGGDARLIPPDRSEKGVADRLARMLHGERIPGGQRARMGDDDALAVMIALARPGFIAKRRDGAKNALRYLTASGIGVDLTSDSPLVGAEWLAVSNVQRLGEKTIVRGAAPLEERHLELVAKHLHRTETSHEWRGDRIVATKTVMLGRISLHSTTVPVEPTSARSIARDKISRLGTGIVSNPAESLIVMLDRLSFLRARIGDPWPDLSAEAVAARPEILATCMERLSLGAAARTDDLRADVMAALPWPEASRMDDVVPPRLTIPSGRQARVDYSPQGPRISGKLQEFFGLQASPEILGQPVIIDLLSPAGAVLATTSDLASFWAGAYAAVRSEMRGRYAKHPWPEDPSTAVATRLTNRALRARGVEPGTG